MPINFIKVPCSTPTHTVPKMILNLFPLFQEGLCLSYDMCCWMEFVYQNIKVLFFWNVQNYGPFCSFQPLYHVYLALIIEGMRKKIILVLISGVLTVLDRMRFVWKEGKREGKEQILIIKIFPFLDFSWVISFVFML